MGDPGTKSTHVTWSVPQCPFAIEYSGRTLDAIRLAVQDAFFSFPRGGAEIGGILLGTHEAGRVMIADHLPIECEHATGPSFTLSANDKAKLWEVLASSGRNVVGWYHSHTRSEIFLSEADLEIYGRFFPEPWHVALVMRPDTFRPMRFGFFFREKDGTIHASAPYQEVVLEPLSVPGVGAGSAASGGAASGVAAPGESPSAGATPVSYRREPGANGTVRAIVDPPPSIDKSAPRPQLAGAQAGAQAAESGSSQLDLPLPRFLAAQPRRSNRWRIAVALGAGLAAGAAGFQTRALWLPGVVAAVRPAVVGQAAPVGLNTLDADGQLQIRWDRNSPSIRQGANGILEIADGAQPPAAIQVDQPLLAAGVFTYARQAERVEVKLTVHLPDGRSVGETTSFMGKLPEHKPAPEDPEIRRQRDELAQQAARLKAALDAQAARTRKLEKSLSDVQQTLQEQQFKRLENQAPLK